MRLPFVWIGNDLSASDATEWLKLPGMAKRCAIGLGWTEASDPPTGTAAIEISNHGRKGMSGVPYPTAITTQPAGSAGSTLLDNIETSCEYMRLTWTRSSGGTGCVWTDDTGLAGTTTVLIIKE